MCVCVCGCVCGCVFVCGCVDVCGDVHYIFTIELDTRGPGELLAADDVDVEVVDGLAAELAVVDDDPVTVVEALLGCDLCGGEHEVAEDVLVVVLGQRQLGDSLAGDDEKVGGRNRVDVAEGHAQVVLKDDVCRDLLGQDLVKDGLLGQVGGGCHALLRHPAGGGGRGEGGDTSQSRQLRCKHSKHDHTHNTHAYCPQHSVSRPRPLCPYVTSFRTYVFVFLLR